MTGAPRAGRRRAYLLAGFDEFLLGYKDRAAQLDAAHAGRVVPGANGVFKPMIVVGGEIVGTWARTVRSKALAIELHPVRARRRGARTAGEGGRGALPQLPRTAARARRSRSGGQCAPRSSCSRATCASTISPHWPPRRGVRSRRAALRLRPRRCSRASARPTALPSCSTPARSRRARCARGAEPSSSRRRRRRGDDARWPGECGADAIFISEDVSALCAERASAACATPAARAARAARPAGRHGRPARRAASRRRRPLPRLHAVLAALAPARRAAPRRGSARSSRSPARLAHGRLPALADLVRGAPSPSLPRGGESDGRRRLTAGCASGLAALRRAARRSRRPTPPRSSAPTCTSAASRRSSSPSARAAGGRRAVRAPALLARLLRAAARSAPEDLARRLSGRAAIAGATTPEALAAWKEGRTGYPDRRRRHAPARREGFMHNRARLLTASFLTKTSARLAARRGALRRACWSTATWPNNAGNWQWVAGTGNRHAPEPRVQPDPPGQALRPGRRLRAPLRPRARRHRGQRGARAVEARAARRRAIPSRSSTTPRRWRDCASARHTRAHDVRRPGTAAPAAKDLADSRYAEPLDVATLARAAASRRRTSAASSGASSASRPTSTC